METGDRQTNRNEKPVLVASSRKWQKPMCSPEIKYPFPFYVAIWRLLNFDRPNIYKHM